MEQAARPEAELHDLIGRPRGVPHHRGLIDHPQRRLTARLRLGRLREEAQLLAGVIGRLHAVDEAVDGARDDLGHGHFPELGHAPKAGSEDISGPAGGRQHDNFPIPLDQPLEQGADEEGLAGAGRSGEHARPRRPREEGLEGFERRALFGGENGGHRCRTCVCYSKVAQYPKSAE